MELRNNFVKPVTAESTQKILEQMKNCICKVKNNQIIGIGFFCRIPYKNNTKINVLITSYQIIDDFYLNQNNQINLLLNDYNELKIINLDPSRKIFSTKNFNTTIIELKQNDNITNYLELDDNLFSNNSRSLYKNGSIYMLQYLNGGNASVSYGILNELNGFNIKHTCSAESCSSGAPILNISNNKTIGISLYNNNMNINYNKGIYLKYAIENFINTSQIQEQQMFNMQNNNLPFMGINNFNPNMMNLMPNMMMNNNINLIPNMMMMNNNINLMPNMMMNNDFNLMPNMMINDNFEPQPKNIKKMNVIFKTSSGKVFHFIVDYGTTVKELLKKFFDRIGLPDLIGCKDIIFYFNAKFIEYENQTPIEKFFDPNPNPVIIVNDAKNIS